VLLIVNTASRCGFTPQYHGLQRLYEDYRERGFQVLAFPCNQFREQEPGSAGEISQFCEINYGVTFPMFAKIEVNGPGAHPIFRWLKAQAPGILGTQRIKWNFTKFLIGRDGRVVKRFGSNVEPDEIRTSIEALL
jgi:glutathione peroxidase